MKFNKRKIVILLVIVFFILVTVAVSSAIHQITTLSKDICDQSPYRRVSKSGTPYMMVSTTTSAEWTSFTNNYPTGVGLSVTSIACCLDSHCSIGYDCINGACVESNPPGECSGIQDCLNLYPSCSEIMQCTGGNCCTDSTRPLIGCPSLLCLGT